MAPRSKVTIGRSFIYISVLFWLLICWGGVVSVNGGELPGRAAVPEAHKLTILHQPYGPRMCDIRCSRLSECSSPLFNKDDLICYLTNAVNMPKHLIRLHTFQNHGDTSCQEWSTLIVTRQQEKKCIKGLTTRLATSDLVSSLPYNSTITLHEACRTGNLEAVKYIISHQLEDINSRGMHGTTPVMTSVSGDKAQEIFEYLVSQGCDLSLRDQYNNTVLHLACREGKLEIVKRLVNDLEQDIDAVGLYGWTPVFHAVHRRNKEMVELLVNKGCSVEVVDLYKNNILHLACQFGYTDMVKYIVKRNSVDIESRGQKGNTAVMMAAYRGHRDIIEFLVKQGSSLTVVNCYKKSILHLACQQSDVSTVNYILKLNATVKENRDENGRTPLMYAVSEGHKAHFNLLVRKGCNWKAVDLYKYNILHLACLFSQVDMMMYIIKQGKADIESTDYIGRTPLLITAGMGNISTFDLLVSQGANTKAVDDKNNTVLHVACLGGKLDMVKYILTQYKFDIESKDGVGRTPLLITARMGNISTFDLLVSRGANTKAVDDKNSTILHVACLGGKLDLIKHILTQYKFDIESKGGVGKTPLLITARMGNIPTFDLLISQGANTKAVDDKNNTVLHVACLGGKLDLVKHILTKYKFDIESKGGFGRTPVLTVVSTGYTSILDLLVRHGGNVRAVDHSNNDILYFACMGGHLEMVKHVVREYRVNTEHRGLYRQTPVLVAAACGHREVVEFLRKKKCNLKVIDGYGNNIMHIACLHGQVDIVKYLIKLQVVIVNGKNKHGERCLEIAKRYGHWNIVDLLNSGI